MEAQAGESELGLLPSVGGILDGGLHLVFVNRPAPVVRAVLRAQKHSAQSQCRQHPPCGHAINFTAPYGA